MKNKKRNRIMLLLLLLLGLGIGFAALATTLKINGTASVNKNTWNIYWDNIDNINGVEAIAPIIGSDEGNPLNTKVKWSVTFDKPGEYYEFTVDAVNAGTIDAMIKNITHKLNGEEISATNKLPDYIKYSVTYADDDTEPTNGDLLEKRTDATHFTTKTYKIRIEYDRNAVTISDVNDMASTGVTYDLSFEVAYGQYVTPDPVEFSTDSWNAIVKEGINAAKQKEVTNKKCGAYDIGDTKEVDLGDLGVHTVRIANCSTPDVCKTEGFSQTACGFVLEFADIITTHRMNPYANSGNSNGDGNRGGWEYSDMRAFLNGKKYVAGNIDYTGAGIIDKLPIKLKNRIIDTIVISGHGNKDSNNFTTTDKLYLLDAKEIYNESYSTEDDTAQNYERQLDYYEIIDASKTNTTGIQKGDLWWLRSASFTSASGSDGFFPIYYGGYWYGTTSNNDYGVSPAFRLG